MRSKMFLIISFCVLVTSVNLLAQPLRWRLYDKLNLTDKQLEEIQKLQDEHIKNMLDLRNQLDKLAIDLKREWNKETPDKKTIQDLSKKMNDIRSKMQNLRINHWFDIYKLLDDKQKEKFQELRSKFIERGLGFKPWFDGRYKPKYYLPRRGLGPCGAGLGPWWYKD